jgi:glycerol-3-phosphate dehydrogenase
MNRDEMLRRMTNAPEPWDMVVIGGGATGLGVAIDAASRGYQTLLLEQGDFAKGTSSRSTKLVHGGVRYLQQGNVSLVLEALKERGLLRQNAPHLVHNLPFVVPSYDWWAGPFYGIGLRLYDRLAGKYGFGHSQNLSRQDTIARIPTIETEGLRSGVIYYDGQFDDARLAVNMAQTAAEQGATVLNYVQVTGLCKTSDVVSGVVTRDVESGVEYNIEARVVVNATGVFTDSVRRMDDPAVDPIISPSQGVHIVLHKSFLPGDTAIMVPHTDDGRVLFAIPWHDRVVVGTTDTPVEGPSLDPKPFAEELDFLLSHAGRYLTKGPTEKDVLSAFAGLRPLVGQGGRDSTASLSRDHLLHISHSGLVTITGGKWTTYRKMAEDTVEQASILAQLDARPCVTRELHIHGFHKNADRFGALSTYGSDAPAVMDMLRERSDYGELLHPDLAIRAGQVAWAVRNEMARTVEDFLARRTRALFLDARASVECAPAVARLMAEELGRDGGWIDQQVHAFGALACDYMPGGAQGA